MFGIAFLGISLTFAILSCMGMQGENGKRRREARKNGELTYRTVDNKEHLVSNNHLVNRKYNEDMEEVIADLFSGEVYYNITKSRKREAEKELKNQGNTVRFRMQNEKKRFYYGKYKMRYSYIDIDTNIPVNEIFVNGIRFYMELDHGHLLRTVDNVDFSHKVGNLSVNEIINIFNKRQDSIVSQLDLHANDRRWLVDNFFFYDGNHRCIYIDNEKNIHIFRGISEYKYYLSNQ